MIKFSLEELYVVEGLLQTRLNYVKNTKPFTNLRQQKVDEEEKVFIDSSLVKIRKEISNIEKYSMDDCVVREKIWFGEKQ